MELIGANQIPRPRIDLTGIPGSSKLHQFMRAEKQGWNQQILESW
ncbi:unnamed protein product [Pylaiella littoralis]